MKNQSAFVQVVLCFGLSLLLTGCEKSIKAQTDNERSTGPSRSTVMPDVDANHFKVDHPEQFRLVTAQEYIASPELNVTGAVNPDVSRQVPVISLASGRVVEIDAQLGDAVKKGQLLFKVRSTDIAGAFSDYRKAVVNEELAKVQLDRAKLLFEHGAIPKSALETAQNAEDNAKVDLDTSAEHLRLLGSDLDHPTGIVNVYAPVTGVITDQEITNAAGVQALSAPNPFTISDMSHLWVICDVYENDLAQVRLGEYAEIHLTAYPDKILRARINNIGPVLDPNIRTAKVRLQVENPGVLRLGMFVTATFHGPRRERYASIPASAVLHLHDREWVYTPVGNGFFRRLEVVSGNTLPGNMQEITSGIGPGAQVVSDALDLQHTVSE
ncbi:MAG: efflux RND transporter periplasmic adaptor subunit [Acidobacteriaceae bacterium]|nr:efflux RND transporter periplasmic adaptor subunit [Acidobacteriaceae bacterium]MBV9781962.1 efflux RND transporter periplasmic adaptor subunit [Acidobacteriaceae bacterium]